jgi:hypothetical protein
MPFRCRRPPLRQFGLGVLGTDGVGDALVVGGISLPVDAVGVDLEQDGDAAPSAAGDLGADTPELGRRDTTACHKL